MNDQTPPSALPPPHPQPPRAHAAARSGSLDSYDARAERDLRFEERLGRVLAFGVRASSACLAVGLVFELAGLPPALSFTLMTAGLVVLMATPVARVVVSVLVYAGQRDWLFATLTTIVLLEIAASVVAALIFHRRL